MYVCFQTIAELGCGSVFLFSVKEMKHKGIQVPLSFLSCEQSECFWLVCELVRYAARKTPSLATIVITQSWTNMIRTKKLVLGNNAYPNTDTEFMDMEHLWKLWSAVSRWVPGWLRIWSISFITLKRGIVLLFRLYTVPLVPLKYLNMIYSSKETLFFLSLVF